MTKIWNFVWPIINATPGMGAFQIDEEGTFENEAQLIWDWFHVVITEPLNLKCGTVIYYYADVIDNDIPNMPKADYELASEDGDIIKLYQIEG